MQSNSALHKVTTGMLKNKPLVYNREGGLATDQTFPA